MTIMNSPLTAEQQARVDALKIVLSRGITHGNAIKEAIPFAKFILTGEAPKSVPVAAGEAPADSRARGGSEVPATPGEASDGRPQGGRPSARPARPVET